MKVRILKQTTWGGCLKVGAIKDVDQQTAQRWINKKIAEPVGGEATCQSQSEPTATSQPQTQAPTSEADLTPKDGKEQQMQKKKKPSNKQRKKSTAKN